LTLVSIYLYSNSKTKRKGSRTKWNKVNLVKDFAFVWVLLGLLIFYIISVNIGSAIIFAVGNIIVEVILIIYLLKSSFRKSEQTSLDRTR